MADIGKISPGNPIVTHVPREPSSGSPREQHKPDDEQEKDEGLPDEEEKGDDETSVDEDKDGGIDVYV